MTQSCRLCNNPDESHYDDDWVACEECEAWYHFSCVSMTWKRISRIDKYVCNGCAKSGNGHIQYHDRRNRPDVPDIKKLDPTYRPGQPLERTEKRQATAPLGAQTSARKAKKVQQITSPRSVVQVPDSQAGEERMGNKEDREFFNKPYRPGLGKNARRVGDIVQVMPYANATEATPTAANSVTHVSETRFDDAGKHNTPQDQGPASVQGRRFTLAREQDSDQSDAEPRVSEGFGGKPYRPGLGKNARRVGGDTVVEAYGPSTQSWNRSHTDAIGKNRMGRVQDWVRNVKYDDSG